MTEPYYFDAAVTLYHGDNREVLKHLDANSLDACVTDPPYELGFMGRHWDASGIAYDKYLWAEVWRVLKPGGHLLAFGGTRTWHRLACAIEDAGFEVRDSIAWMYGSGFPKSLDVSKAIDKKRDDRAEVLQVTSEIARLRDLAGLTNRDLDNAFGFAGMAGHWTSIKSQPTVPTVEQWAVLRDMINPDQWLDAEVWRLNGRKGTPGEAWAEREVVGVSPHSANRATNIGYESGLRAEGERTITAPATPAAQQWQGWGTALKPAFEPIVVARKPLTGTVAENVQQYGTGALNIDGCRIGYASDADKDKALAGDAFKRKDTSDKGWSRPWMEDAERVAQMNAESKERAQNGRWPANVILDESQAAELDRQSGMTTGRVGMTQYGSGTNSVFGTYARTEQSTVIDGTPDFGRASRFFYTAKADSSERPRVDGIGHPTVKPLDLMRYLVRLVTPPGGTVLEPFAGSGTTAEACIIEGFRCVAIEITDDYLPLIMQRITKPIEVTLL